MNTTVSSFSSEHSWTPGPSRRGSIESILSIQGKETDFVRDTSDTETLDSDDERDLEYEPVTEAEDNGPVSAESSEQSDNEIISTKVIEVAVRDDGDLEFADSEQTDSEGSDSEVDLYDYWQCAQCGTKNNNPLYRYCDKCFKVRKNFFPPRPKRRPKRSTDVPRTLSNDSGVESVTNSQESVTNSQELVTNSQDSVTICQKSVINIQESVTRNQVSSSTRNDETDVILGGRAKKRRAESVDGVDAKRPKPDSDSDSEMENRIESIIPLTKTISDPALTIDDTKITKKLIVNTLKEKLHCDNSLKEKFNTNDNLCIVCFNEPKSGVFVHGRIAHICCCYKCAVKVWAKAKRCPVCNCKVSNVLRAVVM